MNSADTETEQDEEVEPSPGLKECREWEEHLRSLAKGETTIYFGDISKNIAIAALYTGYLLNKAAPDTFADEAVEVEPQADQGAGTQHGGEARQPQPVEVEPQGDRGDGTRHGGEARQPEPVKAEQQTWRQCAKCGTWIPPHKLVAGAHEHVCTACRRGKV